MLSSRRPFSDLPLTSKRPQPPVLKANDSSHKVHSVFYGLANTFKSYWLPATLRANLALRLPSHLPWVSFSASYLRRAIINAVLLEKNLASDRPRLYSHTLIEWPFSPPKVVFEAVDGLHTHFQQREERPSDVIWRHLPHHNGEWLFIVSKDAAIRILHLRTGKLACHHQDVRLILPFHSSRLKVRFAVDFMGDHDCMMALATDETEVVHPDRQKRFLLSEKYVQFAYIASIRFYFILFLINPSTRPEFNIWIYHVKLHPDTQSATLQLVKKHSLEIMPTTLDIASDYIIFGRRSPSEGRETVTLLQWKQGISVDLKSVRSN